MILIGENISMFTEVYLTNKMVYFRSIHWEMVTAVKFTDMLCIV